jgi:hypothetical protein
MNATPAKSPPRIRISDISVVLDASRLLAWLAPLPVRRAIDGLVRLDVLAVTPGHGAAPSTFHMALPRRVAAALAAAAAVDDLPQF